MYFCGDYNSNITMNKDLLKNIITEYQSITENIEIHPRDLELEANLNYVLVGLRRAGKSFILYQHIRKLIMSGHSKEEILYINFEDDRLQGMQLADLDVLKQCYEELYAHKPFFFMDEIQNVDGWEHFARRLADQHFNVYITGSNSKMLSREIAGTLGGRYMIQSVFPYSFKEYLSAHGILLSEHWMYGPEKNEIIRKMNDYFVEGGLPEVMQVPQSLRRSWLSNLYNKIFFGDILMRYSVRNTMAFKILMSKLAESVKQPVSYSRLANIVSSVGQKVRHETVIDYLTYAEESCLIFSIENYAAKIVEKSSNKKYYFADNGLLNLLLTDPRSSLLENMVAIHLFHRYGEGLMFYSQNIEVDFFLWEQSIGIQASYTIADDESTRSREINGLVALSRLVHLKEMIIVTYDESDEIQTEEGIIQVVPLWQCLLK